jgi:nicotinate phosphoribosyltransferase
LGVCTRSTLFFLVDTYHTLEQGVPHAIEAFKILEKEGIFNKKTLKAIRIDSGDLDELSHKSRKMLDQNGLSDVQILVSNEINEEILESLLLSNSPIDFYGIGTKLVTGDGGASSLGAVYKLVAIQEENQWKAKIKISENKYKMTIPGLKNIIRFYDKDKKAMTDLIILEIEKEAIFKKITNKKSIKVHDPIDMMTFSYITNYHETEVLLNPILIEGQSEKSPCLLEDVKEYKEKRLESFRDFYKRRINPHLYRVGLSSEVAELRAQMILESKHF